MSDLLLWQLAYHLSGPTILGRTDSEPLGSLPVNLRTAVLKTLAEFAPETIHLNDLRSEQLKYEGQVYEWIQNWSTKDERWLKMMLHPKAGKRLRFASAHEYFKYHQLYRPQNKPKNQDEHFAEREFVERAFIPAFGLEGLSYLAPQVKFKDSEGKTRRIDFVLDGTKQYALEVEGETYHGQKHLSSERFDEEKQRQRDIFLKAGYHYIPYSYSQIKTGEAKTHLSSSLTQDDPVLMSLVDSAAAQTSHAKLTYLEQYLAWFPLNYPVYQKLALTLLWEAVKQNQPKLVLADNQPAIAILELAFLDMLVLVEQVAKLYGLSIQLPEITIYLVDPKSEWGNNRLLANYLQSENLQADKRVNRTQTKWDIRWVKELPPNLDTNNIFTVASLGREVTDRAEERLSARINKFLNVVGNVPPLHAQVAFPDRSLLDYFARRYFLISELKMEQVLLIQRTLKNESGLGILPTGFGKSIIFQLYALLVPRTTIVVSPLRSLIRDQIHNLERLGFRCAEAITSFDNPAEKDAKLRAFQNYSYRLLYISPERLQIKSFIEEVKTTIAKTPVGALAIDEAHCVSEWGHDFRPAYLQLHRFRASLEEASQRPVPVIALTATASEMVRKDILSVLGLPPESVEQLRSSDRPNLSFSVHAVDEPGQKIRVIEQLIQKTIPNLLSIDNEELLGSGEYDSFPHAGVIFSIYANPHGRSTIKEGVHYIADELRQRLKQDDKLVQVHASTAPQICPNCQSPLFITGYIPKSEREEFDNDDNSSFSPGNRKSGNTCLKCGKKFTQMPGLYPKWDNEILKRQDDFQRNRFPLLVATKGFGMGIDKRNIRFIIHHTLSSSLEGYYQEVGRSGRDNNHAHASLVYSPPHQHCRDHYIFSRDESVITAGPPCVSEKKYFSFYKCPYYSTHLCDYGYQARFIQASYPGIEKDTEEVLSTYEKLTSGEEFISIGDEANNKYQISLYRLQQLGIIKGYTVKYLTLDKMQFEVDFDHRWPIDTLLTALEKFLTQTNISREQIIKLRQVVRGPSREADRMAILKRAVAELLKQTYNTVRRMRYQMLRNELRFATLKIGDCRRYFILSIFDDHPPAQDYQCNFCDTCSPELNFERKRAELVPVNAHIDEIAQQLPGLFESFDATQLPEVVQRISDYQASSGMFNRVANRLEHDPNNPSALFVAGALGCINPDTQQESLGYLKRGFDQGVWQGLPKDGLLLFYQQAKPLSPQESFAWLTDDEGPWNDQEGVNFLYSEAHEIFGAESYEARSLTTLREIRSTKGVAEEMKAVIPILQSLTEGFADIMAGLEL